MEDNNVNEALEFDNEMGRREAEKLAAEIYSQDLYPSFESINEQYRNFYRLSHLLTIRLAALNDGGNDFEAANETREQLWEALSPGTWIEPFLTANKEIFNIVNGLQVQKPKFYYSLDEKGRKSYDDARRYYIDTTNLQSTFKCVEKLLSSIQYLKYLYQMVHAYDMLADNGYDESLYKEIDKDFMRFNEFLAYSYDTLEGTAEASKRFYMENSAKLGDDALKAGYLAKRWEDFDNLVEASCNHAFNGNGKGKFSVNPDRKLKLSTIDNYTSEIVEISEDLERTPPTTPDAIVKAAETVVKVVNSIPGYNHDGSRIVAADFCALAEAAKALALRAKEIDEGFMKKMDSAPYSFMRIVPSFKASDPKGLGFAPPSVEPRENGTAYVATYIEMARVLGKFAEEFVNNHGTYFKK